jgi:hypothetical protein
LGWFWIGGGEFIAVVALGKSFQTRQTRSKYDFLLERLRHLGLARQVVQTVFCRKL